MAHDLAVTSALEASAPSREARAPVEFQPLAWAAVAAAAWGGAALATLNYQDIGEWSTTGAAGLGFATLAGLVLLLGVMGANNPTIGTRVREAAPWLIASGIFFAVWEFLTAKIGYLPQPFFPPPQAMLDVVIEDWARLSISVGYSLRLLLTGYLIGAAVGFVTGIAIGWSRTAAYWIHPILRLVGPLPAVAWLPLAFFAFPSSWSASLFLIALAAGIPVTILTWSGVSAVPSSYFDVARTLGASQRFLIFKVAVPAAMPSVFVGLFMGLSASFAVLVVAEMLGVKAGLGWYLQWAQGWAAYANMYTALLLMSLMCSSLVTLLFKLRDRLLGWQKGLVRW